MKKIYRYLIIVLIFAVSFALLVYGKLLEVRVNPEIIEEWERITSTTE